MTAFFAQKHLGALRPLDEHGEQILRKIPQGADVRVEVTVPRNVQHHRLFWALATAVWKTLPHGLGNQYPTVEDVVGALKVYTGHCRTIVLSGGMVAKIPKSIAFAKMDQTAFDAFFERCCDVIAREFLPDVTSEQWRQEIERMAGMREAA